MIRYACTKADDDRGLFTEFHNCNGRNCCANATWAKDIPLNSTGNEKVRVIVYLAAKAWDGDETIRSFSGC